MTSPAWFRGRTADHPTLILGILNVTPDSFSDGGAWATTDTAVARGRQMWRQGADIVDIGGESTRPGAERVEVATEIQRVLPVVRELSRAGIACSIDTMRAEVAAAAVSAGALIVNDVSGGLADAEMALATGRLRVAGLPPLFVAMHWRGHSTGMDAQDTYGDVTATVTSELSARVTDLLANGIQHERIVLDPGLGFAKVGTNNWPLLQNFDQLQALGHPVLVGASRKRFLTGLDAPQVQHDDEPQAPTNPHAKDAATAAITAILATKGAWGVRVHDVRSSYAAVQVAAHMRSNQPGNQPSERISFAATRSHV